MTHILSSIRFFPRGRLVNAVSEAVTMKLFAHLGASVLPSADLLTTYAHRVVKNIDELLPRNPVFLYPSPSILDETQSTPVNSWRVRGWVGGLVCETILEKSFFSFPISLGMSLGGDHKG